LRSADRIDGATSSPAPWSHAQLLLRERVIARDLTALLYFQGYREDELLP
jgi:hypothetical protein